MKRALYTARVFALECEPEATTCPTVVRNKMFCFQVNSVITTVFVGLVVIF